jgi:hypothetical protein
MKKDLTRIRSHDPVPTNSVRYHRANPHCVTLLFSLYKEDIRNT